MQYFGGKTRIAKNIANVLNAKIEEKESKDNVVFVDLFCGSCNVISKIDDRCERWANDKHKYLIAMWKAVQNGYVPPSVITEEDYKWLKENKDVKPYLTGFVGFACSFAGKWFGGYARNSKGDISYNYASVGVRSIKKKIKIMDSVKFFNSDYRDISIPDGAIVYCDIPYKNSTPYCKNEVGKFEHDEFYQWVEQNKNRIDIYVSEYKHNIPKNYEIVWEKESKKSIRDSKNVCEKTIEVLIKAK